MKLRYWLIIFTTFVLLGTACTPTPGPGPSQVWIIAPASGAILPLAPVNLQFEGASFVGITVFEIKVDGNAQATVPPSSSGSGGQLYGTKFFGEYLWNPPGTGVYTITVRAQGNGQFSPATEIEVTIEDLVVGNEAPLPIMTAPPPAGIL